MRYVSIAESRAGKSAPNTRAKSAPKTSADPAASRTTTDGGETASKSEEN